MLEIEVPRQIENDFNGLSFLNDVLYKMTNNDHDGIVLDFKKTRWFEANLTSILGTIITESRKLGRGFKIININGSIYDVFAKNGFLEYYNLGKSQDLYQSTIKYEVFNANDDVLFAEYVSKEVIPRIRMTITRPVEKSFISSLNEIFGNVGLHAKSDKVYTCGQYYHKHKMVAFTIVDLGDTIPYNIRDKYGYNLSDKELINWATVYGNTTREDDSVGGIGLSIIDRFLEENSGVFQIVSGTGFWEKNAGELSVYDLNYHFPGTIVNIITRLESTIFNWSEDVLF